MTCRYCSLKCIAYGCECKCHDEDIEEVATKKSNKRRFWSWGVLKSLEEA